MAKKIPFNKPIIIGAELNYISQSVHSGKISGNGLFTKKCHRRFEEKYGYKKCLMTTSCTDALEMAAILCNIEPGDEIIAPSYTFVSTVNAFILRGAKIVFCDSRKDHPGMDEGLIESLITPRTRVIVPVHYAGVACNMEKIMSIAKKNNLYVVEDAAQAIDSYYVSNNAKRPLGSFGHLAAFSFHETKNIIAGEGGMLVINDDIFIERAEIIWEKGTNRSAFFKGEVNKYGWVDIGSSFLPSDIIAAFLYAQLEKLDTIQEKRLSIWRNYQTELELLETEGYIQLPQIPNYATNNAHMFYIICKSNNERDDLIEFLKKNNIHAVFHYMSLHKSRYYLKNNNEYHLPNSDLFEERLIRLPFYFELSVNDQMYITNSIRSFFKSKEK
ncbi:dTDP-4-amino-4,6-dideoxygalactose transaminase [Crocinitomicaceae bacterium]|nr:dTDP-4-amino-4,6-dideoxygalactose transaminase [Crocinitomicaceae bacterium]